MEEKSKSSNIGLIIIACVLVVSAISIATYYCFFQGDSKAKKAKEGDLKLTKITDLNVEADFYDNIIECNNGYIINYRGSQYGDVLIVDKNKKDITEEVIKNKPKGKAYWHVREENNIIIITYSDEDGENERAIFLDKKLRVILDVNGFLVDDNGKDIYIFKVNNKYKIFDLTKEKFIESEYSYARVIGKKYIRVQTNSGVGIIDKEGKEVLPPVYDSSEKEHQIYYSDYYVSDDIIVLHKNKKNILIDLTNKKEFEVNGTCHSVRDQYVYCIGENSNSTDINIYNLSGDLIKTINLDHKNITPNNCGENTIYVGITYEYSEENNPFKVKERIISYNDSDNYINVLNNDNEFEKLDKVIDFEGNPLNDSNGKGLLVKQKSGNICSIEDNKGNVIVDSFNCNTEEDTCYHGYEFGTTYFSVTKDTGVDYYDYNGKLLIDNVTGYCNKDNKCITNNINDRDNYKVVTYTGEKKDYQYWYQLNDNYVYVSDEEYPLWYKDGIVIDLKGNVLIDQITNVDLYGDILVVERWKDDISYIKSYTFYDKNMKEIKNDINFINHNNNFYVSEDGIYKLEY